MVQALIAQKAAETGSDADGQAGQHWAGPIVDYAEYGRQSSALAALNAAL